MEISGLEEYGLRCALQLARLYKTGKSISASEIASIEGISTEYVSKFMFLLRKGNLVKARRGAKGGFYLAVSPEEISLKMIFESLHSKPYQEDSFCNKHSGQLESCVHVDGCSVRPIWSTLTKFWLRFLESIKLSELIQDEAEVHALISSRWMDVVQNQNKNQSMETNPNVKHASL